MSQTFDVIIIGGGIMGCTTAFELAQRDLKVAVIDKKTIGEGPTGKSSSIIRQHYSNELTARMALHSLRVFQNFEEIIGEECGFTVTGFLALVKAADRAGLEANVALQQGVGHGFDGCLDQGFLLVVGYDVQALGQHAVDLGEFFLHPGDDRAAVGAEELDHLAGDHLAGAVA